MSDAVERAAAIAATAKDRDRLRRERNRERMPESAAWIDSWREVFGALPYGRVMEAGQKVVWGRPSLSGYAVVVSPPQPIAKDKRGRVIQAGKEQPTARAIRRTGNMRFVS